MNDSVCSYPTHHFVFAKKKPINNNKYIYIYIYTLSNEKKPYACSTSGKLKESEHIK